MRLPSLLVFAVLMMTTTQLSAQSLNVQERLKILRDATKAKDIKKYMYEGYGFAPDSPAIKGVTWQNAAHGQKIVSDKLKMPFLDGLAKIVPITALPDDLVKLATQKKARTLELRFKASKGKVVGTGSGNYSDGKASHPLSNIAVPAVLKAVKLDPKILEVIYVIGFFEGKEHDYLLTGSTFSCSSLCGISMAFKKEGRGWMIHEIDGGIGAQ